MAAIFASMKEPVTIASYTLGCKLNYSETSYLLQQLDKGIFKQVPFRSKADIYIINTCTVTSAANSKSRNAIKRAIASNSDALIAVTGCYAQLKPHDIAGIAGVHFITGSNGKNKLAELISNYVMLNTGKQSLIDAMYCDSFEPACSYEGRTRGFLKIQDGCSYRCSYCTIPMARGNSRSASMHQLLEQTETMKASGVHEIVLTGVNIGDYGRGTHNTLIDLLKELEHSGLPRIRLGSIEPDLLGDDIIDFMAQSSCLMPHFHIPLQSGSNNMLKLMRRRYNRQQFGDLVNGIRKKIPAAFIGIDVMVGVNGETEALFNESFQFVQSLDVSFLHVFSYSERENTLALSFSPVVGAAEKARRSGLMHELSNQKHNKFCISQIGQQTKVLWESRSKNNMMYGFTENYLKTETAFRSELVNTITRVRLTGIADSGNMTVDIG